MVGVGHAGTPVSLAGTFTKSAPPKDLHGVDHIVLCVVNAEIPAYTSVTRHNKGVEKVLQRSSLPVFPSFYFL